MWLRGGEFRARVVEPGRKVRFFPTDSDGKKRSGGIVTLENETAAAIAAGWQEGDRVFYYHDLLDQVFEGGFWNERAKEKIRI